MDHSFIKTYPNALSDEACDAIMDQFWKDDWLHMPGRTTAGVDPNKKESLEIGINPELLNYNKTWHDLMQPFLKALENVSENTVMKLEVKRIQDSQVNIKNI